MARAVLVPCARRPRIDMTPHYLRFAQVVTLVGTAALASACGPTTTAAPCNRNGQRCTVGEPVPTDDSCCQCGAAVNDAGVVPDGAAGTWSSACIGGPLPPPSLAA
jgi:hypothetical protein